MRALRTIVSPVLREVDLSHAARCFSFSRSCQAKDDSDADRPPRPKSTVAAARDLMQPRFDRERNKNRDGRPLRRLQNVVSPKHAYQKATTAAANAHVRNLPWMAQYLDHQATSDEEGYSVLGTVGRVVRNEEPAKKKASSSLQAELQADFQRIRENTVQQINPQKKYLFKDTYSPEDLNPYKRAKQRIESRSDMIKDLQHKGTLLSSLPKLRLTDTQIRREVDYKNVPMLLTFVGKQGAILGRRKGHVRAVTQRKLARAVKNARQMALMPHVGLHPAFADVTTTEMQALLDDLEVKATATMR